MIEEKYLYRLRSAGLHLSPPVPAFYNGVWVCKPKEVKGNSFPGPHSGYVAIGSDAPEPPEIDAPMLMFYTWDGDWVVRGQECVEDLLNWLINQGHINAAVAEIFMTRVRRLEQDLPEADRASKIIAAAASKKADFDLGKLDCDDYMEFDIWIISRIERDRFWFRLEGLEPEWGPALLPVKAAQLLKPGWQIACAFVRAGDGWRIAEFVNIYPEERVVDLDSPYCEAKC